LINWGILITKKTKEKRNQKQIRGKVHDLEESLQETT